ncbi:MAG: alpha/beta hydrolase [Gemmatimonadota bacterium]|nr:alpha/beta hydrolase [Gemmatimonadota bacterium]
MHADDDAGQEGDPGHRPVQHDRSLVAPTDFRPAHRVVTAPDVRRGAGGRLFVLHGFLGAGRNWAAVARGLVRSRPDWEAVLVDLRLHGDSLDAPPPHDLDACARDVARLVAHLPAPAGPCALLGHSFGGKVALAAAPLLAVPPVQTWLIDATPAPGGSRAGAAELLDLAARHRAGFPDRRAGADAVEAAGFTRFLAEWMATNLERRGGGYAWRFDPQALRALLDSYARADLWSVVEQPPAGTELRFVRATRGSILAADAAARLARREADGAPVRLQRLEGGHWLNADDPEGLVQLLREGLPRA